MQFQKKLLLIGGSRYNFTTDDNQQLSACKFNTVDPSELAEGNDVSGLYIGELKGEYHLFEKLKTMKPLNYYNFKLNLTMQGKKTVVEVLDVDTTVLKGD